MTVNELITLFRRETEDSAYTYDRDMPESFSLWSNLQLIQYIDQAQNEFAERTYCFKDGSNFTISVLDDGTAEYELDDRILHIIRAESLGTNFLLAVKSIEEFETGNVYIDDYGYKRDASWETRTGTPRILITDIMTSYVRLYPIPDATDTIKLTVRRLPLYTIAYKDQTLEIPSRFHHGLLYKMQKDAYSSPKALNMGFGESLVIAEKKWEDFILDAKRHFTIKTRGPGKTRYGGI